MASKLYVGGLSYSTTSETLREYFAQCGTVESAAVITDKFSGQSRGFGFVEMTTAEEAQRAISELNGKDLDGRKLTVNLSTPKAPGSGGGGPRGGGRARGQHPPRPCCVYTPPAPVFEASGRREGSRCEAAPEGRRRGVALTVSALASWLRPSARTATSPQPRAPQGLLLNDADGPLSAPGQPRTRS